MNAAALPVGKMNGDGSFRIGDDGTLLVGVPLTMKPLELLRNDVRARATFVFDVSDMTGVEVKS